MGRSEKEIRIGCQSWGYDDWITPAAGETVFYPRGTKQSEMLPLYAEIFDTIEIDATAYGIPPVSNFELWYARSPDKFTFAIKVPKQITHDRNLEPDTFSAMEEFLERAAVLKEKLGVILIQLPARFDGSKENAQNLRHFLSLLPAGHRFAVEFRNSDWFIDWTYEELRSSGVALALVEGPWVPRETMFDAIGKADAEHCYIRIMGERDLERFDKIYRHRDAVLSQWKEAIDRLGSRDIFIYVDNYFEGHAPATANKLKRMLGIPETSASELDPQGSLF